MELNNCSKKIKSFLKNINKIQYTSYRLKNRLDNNNCWYCNHETFNQKFCSIFCTKVYNSNDFFYKSFTSISMFPFEYFMKSSQNKLRDYIYSLKEIEYDDIFVMYLLNDRNTMLFEIRINIINNYKITHTDSLFLNLIINYKSNYCVYCDSIEIKKKEYIKNKDFFIGYFCSKFCKESFIFRNRFLPVNLQSQYVICGKEYFDNFEEIKEKFKKNTNIYTTITQKHIHILNSID